MTKIFIIVLNWNQPKLTIETFQSLQKLKVTKEFQVKIIIVDNGSNDNSVAEFRKLKPGKFSLEIMEAGRNLGFAAGNNLGMKYAIDKNADYVLLVNNDVIVDSNLLTNLLKKAEENKNNAIISPKIYFAKGFEFHKKYKKTELGKVIWYAGGKIDWKNIYATNNGVDEIDKKQYDKSKEIDFATGACMLINIKALKEVGLFDEKYFMYLEDADLSVRLGKKGYKIIYEPRAFLWHKVAQSSGIGSDLNDYFISRNRLLFGFKYAKMRAKFALFRESLRLFIMGRHFQGVGIRDFYLRKFRKGSWE
ncbi:MAG TPA: glycosyltransferase family 2 protein [Patescibacteria group bacterium]|nr:glycosyltransferase family 2 protein [Patescibacteria group bacterium]